MPIFKEVFVYTEGDKGFTEVWYSDHPTLAVAATFESAFFSNLLQFRNALTTLRKIRISDVLNNRSTIIVNVNRSAPFSNSSAAISGASAIVTINSTDIASRRQVWLRGLDANQVVRDAVSGADRPPVSLLNNIRTYILTMAGSNYRVRALEKVNPATGFKNIISITSVAGAGSIKLTFGVAHGLVGGDRLIVSQANVKDYPGLNGHYGVIDVPDAQSLVIRYNMHVTGTFLLAKGRIRKESYVYGAINTSTSKFNFFSTRDTGRSPLGGRGRRSGVRIRSA